MALFRQNLYHTRFKLRPKSLRTKSERSSGGQEGHPGETLEWRVEVDEVRIHPVEICCQCGGSLSEVAAAAWDLR